MTRRPAQEKGKRARPQYTPREEDRELVMLLVGFGLDLERVAMAIKNPATGRGINRETLVRHYSAEIAEGRGTIDALVAEEHWRLIRNGDLGAIIWFQKNRWNWRERAQHAHEISGPSGGPIENKVSIEVSFVRPLLHAPHPSISSSEAPRLIAMDGKRKEVS